jgi:putative MATE family efflux protein
MLSPLVKKVLNLSLPAALNSFLDMLQTLVDLIMVGRISPAAIASVGVSMQLIWGIYVFVSVFHIGTNALVSRFVGAKKIEDAGKVIFSVSIMAFLFSLPIAVLGFLFSEKLFLLIGTSKDVAVLGGDYLGIVSLTIPFLFLGGIFYSALSASGDTKTPLKVGIAGNILNTILDYILIFGHLGFPELGVKGAAIATATTNVFEVLVYLVILFSKKFNVYFYFEYSFDLVKRALKVGIPTGVERLITYSSYIALIFLITEYGTYTLAGYQVGLRIEGLAFMPGIGFTIAAMALVGQNLGAKRYKEAENSAITTMKVASVLMGTLGILMIFIPEYLCMIFTSDEKTIEEAVIYLRMMGISQFPLAVVFVLSGSLRGAGATKSTLIINTSSLWIIRMLPAFIFSEIFHNVLLIYLVITIETYIRAFILWYVFKKGNWKKIEV